MINIKIYGTGTPSYELAKTKLTETLDFAEIKYNLVEVKEINSFIEDNVVSVPAIKVNDNQLFEIKPNGNYNKSLRETIQSILKLENYGKMNKIVVPTDFSEASFNAYNYANHLAKDLGGVLQLTHIYYPTSTDVNQFVVTNDEAEKNHREKLSNFVQSVNQDWIGNFVTEPLIEGVFKVGFPRVELTDLSKNDQTIMVMGTTGEGDAFKKIFGSLSLDMIDKCYCPLFLIPPDVSYTTQGEICYLSENLKNDTLHLLHIGKLCLKLGAALKLVHFRLSDKDEYDVKDTIDMLQNYFPDLKYHIEISDTKSIFKEIADLLNSKLSNLVVMSTKHRNIFQGIFHKSATEYAAMHSKTPLLILSDHIKE